MVEFKNNLVRVRCMECEEEHSIEMCFIETGSDLDIETNEYEYEHSFEGKSVCPNCGTNMTLSTIVWEEPNRIICIDVSNDSCLEMDNINVQSFNIN